MRHRWLAAVVLVALIASVSAPTATVAQSGPIKIELLAPLSGVFSSTGKDMLAGTELYLGRQVAGRKIELIVEDSEGNPQTALAKARKLVDQDNYQPCKYC